MRESRVPPSPIKIAIRKGLIEVGPMDCGELSRLIGTTREVVAQYVRQMRASGEAIGISDWVSPDGVGRAAPIYAVGERDVPKPGRQSIAEQKRKRYAKNRATVRIQQSGKKSTLYRLNNILGL